MTDEKWRIEAPSGRLVAAVAKLDLAGTADFPATQNVYYRVELDGIEVLAWSPLGIRTASARFVEELSFLAQSEDRLDETYAMPTGKRRMRRFRASQRILRFANRNGAEIEIIFRVADDGVAWRYRLLGDGEATALGEESGFRFPSGTSAWLIPYDRPTRFAPAYERNFERYAAGDRGAADNGWGYGALFRLRDAPIYALLSEADLDTCYAGTHLAEPVEGIYRVAYPNEGEGNGVGSATPVSLLPWTTPWRVAIVGDLATVFASTLIDDLSKPPSAPQDLDWTRPGRSAWSWFSQETGTPSLQREYVDFAAEMGWEYVLVDAHWNEWPGADDDVRALVDYAASRGVAILLWYNSGGAHNVVPEPPRDRMSDPAVRRAELARISAWGVAGVKVDFFQSEKQDRIAQYLAILEDAREQRLLVNFHGSTLPRGWQRTHPHLMSMEGVRGAEYYKFFDPPDAIHNVRLAFTRNVVGSMDYTPVTFAAAWEKRGITYAHQVALSVVFESGIQHFAERADSDPTRGFRKVFVDASFARDFFRDVPTVWDESLLLEGSPDSFVVMARRSGTRWYVAAVSGLEQTLRLDLSLAFLGGGRYALELIRSGNAPTTLAEQVGETGAQERMALELGPKDGFVAVLVPAA